MSSFKLPSKDPSVSPYSKEIEAILEDIPAVMKCCNSFTGPNPFTSILSTTKSCIPKVDFSTERNSNFQLSTIELLEVSYRNRPDHNDQEEFNLIRLS